MATTKSFERAWQCQGHKAPVIAPAYSIKQPKELPPVPYAGRWANHDRPTTKSAAFAAKSRALVQDQTHRKTKRMHKTTHLRETTHLRKTTRSKGQTFALNPTADLRPPHGTPGVKTAAWLGRICGNAIQHNTASVWHKGRFIKQIPVPACCAAAILGRRKGCCLQGDGSVFVIQGTRPATDSTDGINTGDVAATLTPSYKARIGSNASNPTARHRRGQSPGTRVTRFPR